LALKIRIAGCFLTVLLLLGCSSFKNDAYNLLNIYIKAYSTGNKPLLLSVVSKKLKIKLESSLSFFNSRRFDKIKSELDNFKVVITSFEKDKSKYRVYYYLILSRKGKVSDRITMIEEEGSLKLFDTGMFVYR
jgi:hypothetical protein